jgi:hypothetical protein
MATRLLGCLLVIAAFGLTGCKSVVSDHLVGQPIAADEAEELEGVWRFGDSVLHVKHTEGGRFIAAGLDWDDDGFKVEQLYLVVTEHADVRFLHAVEVEGEEEDEDAESDEPEDGEDPRIICGMLTGNDDHAVVLTIPRFERFIEALEAGAIEGDVNEDGNTVHIRGDKATLDALIEAETLHEFFNVKKPIVIKRLGDL